MSLHNLCSRHSQYVELQRENKLSLKRISNLIRFSSNYARKIKENIEHNKTKEKNKTNEITDKTSELLMFLDSVDSSII